MNQTIYIPIVLSFTPNYLVPAATTILSILNSAGKLSKFHVICLLTEELSDKSKEYLQRISKDRLSFTYINLQGKLKDIYVDERYTVAASYRLMLPELLPHLDKVIYLDCDIIVQNDLGNIFNSVSLEDYYMAAVFEPTLSFQQSYIKSLGLNFGEYVNSGFLVLNLKKLREDNIVPRFLEESKRPGLQFPDQDVINTVCRGKILPLPPVYNSIRTFYLPQYKPDFLKKYTLQDWEQVQKSGNIHFTGSKPWNSFTVQFEKWWETYDNLNSELKDGFEYSSKTRLLYKIMKVSFIKSMVYFSQKMYRRLKYSE